MLFFLEAARAWRPLRTNDKREAVATASPVQCARKLQSVRDVRAGRVPHAAYGLATLGGALGRLQGVDLGSGGDLHLHMGSEVQRPPDHLLAGLA